MQDMAVSQSSTPNSVFVDKSVEVDTIFPKSNLSEIEPTKEQRDKSEPKARCFLGSKICVCHTTMCKLVVGLCASVFILSVLYLLHSYYLGAWSKPLSVQVTNVTDKSVTVSWITEKKTPGVVTYSEKDNFMPWVFSGIGNKTAFDDRDVVNAVKESAEKVSARVAADESDPVEYRTLEEGVVIKTIGRYYVHHVTIVNLDPETEYYFMVGNGLRYENDVTGSYGPAFTTFGRIETLSTPSPSYGMIEISEKDKELLTDAIVYMTLKTSHGDSEVSSTVIAENGSWYIDLSNIRSPNGSGYITEYGDTELFESLAIECGPLGLYDVVISGEQDAPAEKIFLDRLDQRPRSEEWSHLVSWIDQLSTPVFAGSCECDCLGGGIQSNPFIDNNCGTTGTILAESQCFDEEDGACYQIVEGCNAQASPDGQHCDIKNHTYPMKGASLPSEGADSDSGDTSSPPAQEAADAEKGSCGGRAHGSCGPSSSACLSKAPPENCYWAICNNGVWTRIEPYSCPGKSGTPSSSGTSSASDEDAGKDPLDANEDGTVSCNERNSDWVLCSSLDESERQTVYRDNKNGSKNNCCKTIADNPAANDSKALCFKLYVGSELCESDSANKQDVVGKLRPDDPNSPDCCSAIDEKEEIENQKLIAELDGLCKDNFGQNTVSQNNANADTGGSKGNITFNGTIYACYFENGVRSELPTQTCEDFGSGNTGYIQGSQTCDEIVPNANDFMGHPCCKSCGQIHPTPADCTIAFTPPENVQEVGLVELLQEQVSCFFARNKVAYCGGNPCSHRCGCTCKRSSLGECETNGVKVKPTEYCPGIKQSKLSVYENSLLSNKPSLFSPVFADSSVNQENSVDEGKLLIAPSDGVYSFSDTGVFCTVLNTVPYCFEINTAGPTKLYIDRNGDSAFDSDDIDLGSPVYELEATEEDEVDVYKIELGFNFISFGLIGGMGETAMALSFLENLNAQYNDAFFSIAEFRDGKWDIVENRDGTSYGSSDFQIIPGRGYLLKATRSFEIAVTGKRVVSAVPVSLVEGWNLIAVHGDVGPYTASSLIDSIDAVSPLDADNVTQWDVSRSLYVGLQKEKDAGGNMEVYGYDFPIDPISSYFVRVASGSGTWTPETGE